MLIGFNDWDKVTIKLFIYIGYFFFGPNVTVLLYQVTDVLMTMDSGYIQWSNAIL